MKRGAGFSRRSVIWILLAIPPSEAGATLSALWHRMTRETSSEASNGRGVKQFADKQYTEAAKSFARSNEIAPAPAAAFNLGTAQVAAGKREEGSATLTSAMDDPSLRVDALFNRGNSALASHAYDHAVRDYIDVLKLRPADPAAKRNLEIALRRREAMQRSQGGKADSKGQQQQPQDSPQRQPSSDDKDEQSTDRDAGEALLRSAQQQEQEELSRMRRSRPEPRRVGW